VTAKHRIVLNGKELKLADDPSMSLKDLGIYSGNVIMIYVQQPLPAQEAGNMTGPEQPDVMRHFEALYTLLDLPEALSVKVCIVLIITQEYTHCQRIGMVVLEQLPPAWSGEATTSTLRNDCVGHLPAGQALQDSLLATHSAVLLRGTGFCTGAWKVVRQIPLHSVLTLTRTAQQPS